VKHGLPDLPGTPFGAQTRAEPAVSVPSGRARPCRAAGLEQSAGRAPAKRRNVLSADEAFGRLMQGNARYVKGLTRRHDFAMQRAALAQGQNPFAGILSCADSRVGPQFAFDGRSCRRRC
jgi:carbonic anhydrase